VPGRRETRAARVQADVMSLDPLPRTYLEARVAAFIAAHAQLRLCPACARPNERRHVDLVPGWCMQCGRSTATGYQTPAALGITRPDGGRAAPGPVRMPARPIARTAKASVVCPLCQEPLSTLRDVVLRRDGRVEHRTCPDAVCPSCGDPVPRGRRVLRDSHHLFHLECFLPLVKRIAGGSSPDYS
jgi:hypothetical protein